MKNNYDMIAAGIDGFFISQAYGTSSPEAQPEALEKFLDSVNPATLFNLPFQAPIRDAFQAIYCEYDTPENKTRIGIIIKRLSSSVIVQDCPLGNARTEVPFEKIKAFKPPQFEFFEDHLPKTSQIVLTHFNDPTAARGFMLALSGVDSTRVSGLCVSTIEGFRYAVITEEFKPLFSSFDAVQHRFAY